MALLGAVIALGLSVSVVVGIFTKSVGWGIVACFGFGMFCILIGLGIIALSEGRQGVRIVLQAIRGKGPFAG